MSVARSASAFLASITSIEKRDREVRAQIFSTRCWLKTNLPPKLPPNKLFSLVAPSLLELSPKHLASRISFPPLPPPSTISNYLLPLSLLMTSQSQTVQNSFLDQLIGSTVHSIRSSLTQPIQLLTSQPSSPTQLALLLPLLASTAQLTFSAAEFLAIRPLVGDNSTAYSSSKARGGGSGGEKEEVFQPRAIQKWWEGFWIPGLGVVVGLGALSVGGGIRGSMMRSRGGGRARGWYLVGSCFALGHFGFGPKVSHSAPRAERVLKVWFVQRGGRKSEGC
ncbi:hypothetical protein BDY24DRAFT_286825 [Mrakia frigida]|uniref:uncharacterized protein n=1 Tax=Mrakia frigida TaxID=29902 RepID=UPI003FCC1D02